MSVSLQLSTPEKLEAALEQEYEALLEQKKNHFRKRSYSLIDKFLHPLRCTDAEDVL
jgi:hypothetical protein